MLSPSTYHCPHCSNPDSIPESVGRCPACNRDLPAPNVRVAESEEEIVALKARVREAERSTDARACRKVLEDFGEHVLKSQAVICRPLGPMLELVSSPNSLYQNFYRQLNGFRRLPESNEFDRQRELVDSLIFPGYRQEIIFAALSLDGKGPEAYGEYHLVLRDEMIGHRATVFEENALVFIRDSNLSIMDKVPTGYRASWENRAELAKAKLHGKLDSSTKESEYSSILLEIGKSTDEGDFIEVHIYQSFNRSAVEKLVLDASESPEDGIILTTLKRNLAEAGIRFEEV